MIKYIIFDVYGTLISTGTGSIDAATKILKNNKSNINPAEFYSSWKSLHRKHINNLTSFRNEEYIFFWDLKELYEIYNIDGDYKKDVLFMLNTLGKRKAFEETISVLNELSKSFVLCIGSTTDNIPLYSDLKSNNINIKNIFTSESMQVYKPKKEFYMNMLNSLKASSKEVLFVGDSLIDDVLGPQKLGIKTCWLNRKNLKIDHEIRPILLLIILMNYYHYQLFLIIYKF